MAKASENRETDQKAPVVTSVPPPKVKPIIEGRVQLAASAHATYRATVPMEDTIEQITDPKYWIHLQHRLKQGDVITFLPDDLRYYGAVIVLSVSLNHVAVKQIDYVEFESIALGSEIPSRFDIVHAGPYEKFRVLEDGKVLISQLQTRDEARQWLTSHVKAQNL